MEPALPTSMREAKTRKREIARDIALIQFQLSSKERKHPDGTALSAKEYRGWRAKAMRKLELLKYEHSVLRDWVSERRIAIQASNLDAPELDEGVTAVKLLTVTKRFLHEHKDKLEGTKRGELYNLIDLFLSHEA